MAQTNLTGKKILGYTITEKIDSGAFGTVYKAVKKNVSGEYIRAVKHIRIPTEKQYQSVLNSMGGSVAKADNYFFQMLETIVSEIQILNDLSEKGARHIVRYYENDIDTTENPRRYDVYILMELLTPLEDYLQQCDVFTVRQVIGLAQDILSGIQSCHDNGIIHRDIKDENIFVAATGEFKIGDFGVSKVLKDSSRALSLKGTPNFLAPEVYLGKAGYTKSVDLYSLGIVLYRLLNYGRNPFLPQFPEVYYPNDEDLAFDQRMRGEIPELPVLGGEAIGRVIVKAISPNNVRYQSVQEFQKDLNLALDQTDSRILDFNVKLIPVFEEASNPTLVVNPAEYDETLAQTQAESAQMEVMEPEEEIVANKNLFVSFTEEEWNQQSDEKVRTSQAVPETKDPDTYLDQMMDPVSEQEDLENSAKILESDQTELDGFKQVFEKTSLTNEKQSPGHPADTNEQSAFVEEPRNYSEQKSKKNSQATDIQKIKIAVLSALLAIGIYFLKSSTTKIAFSFKVLVNWPEVFFTNARFVLNIFWVISTVGIALYLLMRLIAVIWKNRDHILFEEGERELIGQETGANPYRKLT